MQNRLSDDGGPYFIHDNEITGITSSSTMANPQGASRNADMIYFYNNRIHDVWAQTIWGKATVGMKVIGRTEVDLRFNTVYMDYISAHLENTSAALHVSDLCASLI